MAAAYAEVLEGCLAEDAVWADLAEAFTPLLLNAIPERATPQVELEQRMSLWEKMRYDALLARIENQQAGMAQDISKSSGEEKKTRGLQRARRLAKEGACTESVSSLKGASARSRRRPRSSGRTS